MGALDKAGQVAESLHCVLSVLETSGREKRWQRRRGARGVMGPFAGFELPERNHIKDCGETSNSPF